MSALEFFAYYFIIVSTATVSFTVGDKISAKKGGKRVPEDLLLTLGFIGGALAEYITMRIIHHKTRHKKFMIGLPVEIILQIVIVVIVLIYA